MKVNEFLKVIFILCMERLCVFGFIGCIFIGDVTEQGYAKKEQKLTEELQSVTVATVGDVTEQGYAKKKQKLTEELQSVTVATVADTSGFSEAKELEDFRTRMSTGLLKLYGRDRNAIKAAASTPSTAKKEDNGTSMMFIVYRSVLIFRVVMLGHQFQKQLLSSDMVILRILLDEKCICCFLVFLRTLKISSITT